MTFVAFALMALATMASGHHGHHSFNWQREPQQIDAMAVALQKLAPKMKDMMGQESCMTMENKGKICMGPEVSSAVGMAMEECKNMTMDDSEMRMEGMEEMHEKIMMKKCLMKKLMWVDDMGEPIRENIQQALGMTLMDQEMLMGAEEKCNSIREMITSDCVEKIVNGDMKDMDGMMNMDDMMNMDQPSMRAFRRRFYRRRRPSPFVYPAPEPVLTNVEETVEMLKNMAYFGCLHKAIDKVCEMEANAVMSVVPPISSDAVEQAWQESGAIDRFPEGAPPLALVSFPDQGIIALPGANLSTDSMLEPPVITWDCDPTKLYTYIVEDNGLTNERSFLHYMVTNIENCDISTGDVVLEWEPSFSFNADPENQVLIADPEFFHPHAHLIYEQEGEIDPPVDVGSTCAEGFFARLTTHEATQATFGVPVAGSVIYNYYNFDATNKQLCAATKCLGNPLPFLIPGVNDLPECQ